MTKTHPSDVEPGKPPFILDIDETLISAIATEDHDVKKLKNRAMNIVVHDMDGYYAVFERPGVQEFLDYLFKNFTVSIWTAASKDYALFVIAKVVLNKAHPERKLDWVFFSYHCSISRRHTDASKDLSVLANVFSIAGYEIGLPIILDDYSEVYFTQPGQCIVAKPFDMLKEGAENDTFLKNIVPSLTTMRNKILSGHKNPASFVNPPADEIKFHEDDDDDDDKKPGEKKLADGDPVLVSK